MQMFSSTWRIHQHGCESLSAPVSFAGGCSSSAGAVADLSACSQQPCLQSMLIWPRASAGARGVQPCLESIAWQALPGWFFEFDDWKHWAWESQLPSCLLGESQLCCFGQVACLVGWDSTCAYICTPRRGPCTPVQVHAEFQRRAGPSKVFVKGHASASC